MSSADFAEELAFYNIEPHGGQWDDYRFGMLCSLIFNAFKGSDTEPAHPRDFFATLRQNEPPPQEQLREKLFNVLGKASAEWETAQARRAAQTAAQANTQTATGGTSPPAP